MAAVAVGRGRLGAAMLATWLALVPWDAVAAAVPDGASPPRAGKAAAEAGAPARAAAVAAASAVEHCLLERLRTADPRATVAEVHAACAHLAQPSPSGAEPPVAGGSGLVASPAQPPLVRGASPEPGAADTTHPGAGALDGQAVAGQPPAVDASVGAVATITSPVHRRMISESRLWSERFALLPHRPNYILPATHTTTPLGPRSEILQRNEIKLQLSFKFPLTPPILEGRVGVFFAYTGQYWWQAYNDRISSPFREYSHEPEVFVAWRPSLPLLGWTARTVSLGLNHQSNGRAGELSRSWNRLVAQIVFDRPDGWWLSLRPWWRIAEDAKATPDSPEGDDNPQITRFVGDGELRFGHVGARDNWTVTLRRGLRAGGKGSVQIDWSRPTGFSPQLRWYAQYYDGYGESLLDHTERLQRVGIGVMLNDWY